LELHIYDRNLDIDDKTREHVASKLDQIDRRRGLSNATVELAYEATPSQNDRIVAQVTLHVGRTLLRAQQQAATTTSAINSVAQSLDRQIKRFKSHTYPSERNRQAGRGANSVSDMTYPHCPHRQWTHPPTIRRQWMKNFPTAR
jgi:ribosomal subunit interface protein